MMSVEVHRVSIVKTTTDGVAKCVVMPGYVCAEPGHKIQFKAVNTEVTIFIPDEVVAGPRNRVITLKPQEKRNITVLKKALQESIGLTDKQSDKHWAKHGLPGEFPYAVYCRDLRDFGVGNSSPVMILEPPERNGG
jgi:hypothetical protein